MNICWPAVVNLVIRTVPAHWMAYYPFRDRLRSPVWKVLLLIVLLQLGHALLYGWVAPEGRMAVEYSISLLYMVVYFFFVRDNRCKLLFLYLFVVDYSMIQRGVSTFLEARFFYSPGMEFISWRSSLFSLGVIAVSAPFMFHFLANAREKVLRTDAPVFWRTVWLLPAFTTVIVMSFTHDLSFERVRSFQFLLTRLLLLLSVFVVYSILLDALDGIRHQAALEQQAAMQEHLLNLQRTQHERLLTHIEEVKATRHDLRQHLNVMWAYLEKEDIDGLKAYLMGYGKSLSTNIWRTFTQNFALNAVCNYYAEEARKYEIDYDVKLDTPKQFPMSEPEVCALLGNLLKNAIDACREVRRFAPFIKVRGMFKMDCFVLTVDNSCEQEPKWENERLLSSKHEGYGTGTWVVQRTAERNGGTAKFTYQNGVFYSSVLLYK